MNFEQKQAAARSLRMNPGGTDYQAHMDVPDPCEECDGEGRVEVHPEDSPGSRGAPRWERCGACRGDGFL